MQNDKALDYLKYFIKADNESLKGMLLLAYHSEYEEIKVLAVAITDAIMNGRDKEVVTDDSDCAKWFDSLCVRFKEEVETGALDCLKNEARNTAWTIINHPNIAWFNIEDTRNYKTMLTKFHERLDVSDTQWEKLKESCVPIHEKIIDMLTEAYEKLSQLPKPESYRMGGTYYGSTQLFQSVGNMLDQIEWEPYTSYSYGGSTKYNSLYGIRIGGAYKYDDVKAIIKDIKTYGTEHRMQLLDEGWFFIDDFGTNYSVIGIAERN